MKLKRRVTNQLIKKAQKGFRGYPVATVAYYGPDNTKQPRWLSGLSPAKKVNLIHCAGGLPARKMRDWT